MSGIYSREMLCSQLIELLDTLDPVKPPDIGIIKVETFGQAGVLTRDTGFIVTTSDRREWQVTIVRSK